MPSLETRSTTALRLTGNLRPGRPSETARAGRSDTDRDTLTGLALLTVTIAAARLSGVPWRVIVGTLAAGIVGLIGWAIWMHIKTRN